MNRAEKTQTDGMPYNMYMKHYTAKCLTALTLFFLFLAKGWGIDLKGKVIDCTQKGYKLGEKVIRFAKVVVGE